MPVNYFVSICFRHEFKLQFPFLVNSNVISIFGLYTIFGSSKLAWRTRSHAIVPCTMFQFLLPCLVSTFCSCNVFKVSLDSPVFILLVLFLTLIPGSSFSSLFFQFCIHIFIYDLRNGSNNEVPYLGTMFFLFSPSLVLKKRTLKSQRWVIL